uniref:Uncharacterized protein n=1 Tax=Glossina pallidipes TaxID=7398 RepID=A0A1A9Z653_GLOPL
MSRHYADILSCNKEVTVAEEDSEKKKKKLPHSEPTTAKVFGCNNRPGYEFGRYVTLSCAQLKTHGSSILSLTSTGGGGGGGGGGSSFTTDKFSIATAKPLSPQTLQHYKFFEVFQLLEESLLAENAHNMCGKHLLALASGMVLRFAFRNNTLFLLLCYLVIGVVHMRYALLHFFAPRN